MYTLQDLIHQLEVGEGRRYIPITAALLLFIAILLLYNAREATGFATPEAMDTAQLAHNIAQGNGYTTHNIRPLSLALIHKKQTQTAQQINQQLQQNPNPTLQKKHQQILQDPYHIKKPHPDIANPPLYPYLLAAAIKTLPFNFEIPQQTTFTRYQPEILISILNQTIYILTALLLFLIARSLFDTPIAYFATAALLGTDQLWRFAFSGLSTNLTILLLLLLAHTLTKLEQNHPQPTHHRDDHDDHDNEQEQQQNQPQPTPTNPPTTTHYLLKGALCGLLLAALTLTRYSLAWLTIPTLLFQILYLPGRRLPTIAATLTTALLLTAPWLHRNHQLSGNLFGTAAYAHYQETYTHTGTDLERHLQTNIETVTLRSIINKYLRNTAHIIENQIPTLGGSWLTALFLAGLLVPFTNKTLNRLRTFTLLTLLTLATTQAISQTYLTDYNPTINTQNLLILPLPLIYLFGAALLFLLIDRLNLPIPSAHFYLATLALILATLPLLFRILPPRTNPIAYPPYNPPLIQHIGNWFQKNELLMTDAPWATAWYANQKSIWTTRKLNPDFFTLHDQIHNIHGLYLTPITTDGKFVTDIIKSKSWIWGRLHMKVTYGETLPHGFPLLHADDHYLPEHLILTDWPRWNFPKN